MQVLCHWKRSKLTICKRASACRSCECSVTYRMDDRDSDTLIAGKRQVVIIAKKSKLLWEGESQA
jgi:hypothetical protein